MGDVKGRGTGEPVTWERSPEVSVPKEGVALFLQGTGIEVATASYRSCVSSRGAARRGSLPVAAARALAVGVSALQPARVLLPNRN